MGMKGGLLFSFVAISLKANQIISGTAINMIASSLSLLMLGSVSSSNRLISGSTLSFSTDPSKFINMFSFPVFLGIIILIISFIALKYTAWGLRLKMVGENLHLLDSKEISVIKTRYIGIIISAMLASIGGAIFGGNVEGLGFVGLQF